MRRATAFIFALVALTLMPAASRAETDVKLVLDWVFQANHAYFTLADDRGLFAKEALKVKIDRGFGSADTINKVAAGTYDFGYADVNLLVDFNAKNPGSKVVAVLILLDATPSAVIALKKSGIKAPKDLAGKRIAAPAGDNSRVLFPLFARANGLDPESVTWISAQPNIRDTLLLKGETDAVASFSTTTILALDSLGVPQTDLVVMNYADLGVDLFASGVIVAEKYAAAHPEVVKGFVRAVVKGTQAALADPAGSVASVKKRDNLVKDDVEAKRFALVRDLLVLTPSVKAHGLSYVDPKRLERSIDFVAKAMGVANPPKPRDVFRDDYLPPAAERKL
jgi:NitT/TauT family transport system substrate-binding protein